MVLDLKEGDTFANLWKIKRFHIFVYVKDYKGYLLFFDIVENIPVLLSYKTVEKLMTTPADHPVHKNLMMFDYIERLPESVFDVVKKEMENRIKDKEPSILNLFKLCEKN